MFGRGNDDAVAAALLEHGTRGMAVAQELHESKPRHGEVEWRFQLAWSYGGHGISREGIRQSVPEGTPHPGKHVPILFNADDLSQVMVDMAHLHDVHTVTAPHIVVNGVEMHLTPGPRWTVPAECPNCGAVVDQAVASLAADPRCPFCEQPLPVQPAH